MDITTKAVTVNTTAPVEDFPTILPMVASPVNFEFQTMKQYNQAIRAFCSKYKHMIMTSRFTTETIEENREFRKRNTNVGCVYSSPTPITSKLSEDMKLFVFEMNNSINRIEGIGLIQNKAIVNKYKVYEKWSYNRYTYMGKLRISRDELSEEEEEIMRVFDTLCFKGSTNMKRGKGITAFPIEILYKCSKHLDLVEFIRQMFNRRIKRSQCEKDIPAK